MRAGLFGNTRIFGNNTSPSLTPGPPPSIADTRPIHGPARRYTGNPTSRLPKEAAAKLSRLRAQQDELGAILRDLSERQRQAAETKLNRESYLSRLQESR